MSAPASLTLTASSDSPVAVKSPQRVYFVFRDSAGAIVGEIWGYAQGTIPPNGSISEATPGTGFAPAEATTVDATISPSSM